MIYLTNYIKFNESFNDRLDDVSDILLELQDKDYVVEQTIKGNGNIFINISKDSTFHDIKLAKRFTLNDISDVLQIRSRYLS